MKYVLAGLAIVAAVAALFFRPPASAPQAPLPDGGRPLEAAVSPVPTSRVATPGSQIVVYVAGEVMRPGVYRLGAGSRAEAALRRAGGPKPDADLVAVNLAAPLDDGMELTVPAIGERWLSARRAHTQNGRAKRPSHGHRRRRRDGADAAPGAPVNLNAADAALLQTLPGIGPALAARIVAYRDLNGPFASIDELADVAGITPRIQEELAGSAVVR